MMNKKLKLRVGAIETKVAQTEKIAIGGAIGSAIGIGLGMFDMISMRSWKKTVADNTDIVRQLVDKIDENSTVADDGEPV